MSYEKDFHHIYDTHKDMVYNLSLNYLQNREDAEEVMQDVFVKVHQKLDSFKGDSEIGTWVYRITINLCLDRIKAAKRQKRFGFLINIFDKDSSDTVKAWAHFDHPGVELENKEMMESLFGIINQLPEKQKSALLLSKLEGLSQKEIATILETTPKAVESLIQRARKTLKEKWNYK